MGTEYGGLKPSNPTGLVIGLLIHRIEALSPMPSNTPTKPSSAPAVQQELIAIIEPAISPAKDALIRNKIALYDAVQEGTGELSTTDVLYCSRDFVVASLPHSDPGTKEVWSRSNGRKTLTVRSGWNEFEKCHYGLPYGILPRLMYYYLETEVIRKREPIITLGDSMYGFMQSLGIADSSPNYRALRNQAGRLFNAGFQITERLTGVGGRQGLSVENIPEIAKKAVFWLPPQRKTDLHQGELFTSYVVLSDQFFKEMLEHGFPLDANAVKYLRRSSLELDLYAWACHRNFSLNRSDTKAIEISYEAMMEQFGAEYARERDFRAKLRKALTAISQVWRGTLSFEFTSQGLVLRQSPLQITSSA
jgi:hypothetical protein